VTRRVPAAAALAAACLGIVWAAVAQAQAQPPADRSGRTRATIAPDFAPVPPRAGTVSTRPIQALDADQARRLLQAQAMRETGRLDAAREALLALLAESPHHPIVLGELARVHIARQQWGQVEKLALAERAATRDSVLLGRELALAYERQSQPRKAAQTAIEVWLAAPGEADWAEATVVRLDDLEPRAGRDALRRAAEARPARADLATAAARLEWRRGDLATALRLLAATDATGPSTPVRWSFAQELLYSAVARDTSAAIESLMSLAADAGREPAYRLSAARRAWQVYGHRGQEREGVLRVARALADLPPAGWSGDLLVGLVRGLREAGQTAEVRSLLERLGERRTAFPELALEAALNELREGPPARALAQLEKAAIGSPDGVFHYAEALFFAGMPDSALAIYQLVSHDPRSRHTAPALERLFLIEDAEPRGALPALGQMAYETWRGEGRRAAALADSLYRALPRGALWAQAALALAGYREREGDGPGALVPLLALADSLPGDRLAPVARQRAGDVYRLRLKDDAKALAQYEECLARYPKSWNAPEVRRAVETLRRERRF
jgi:tetratricopeptide (TPR) repeat protein